MVVSTLPSNSMRLALPILFVAVVTQSDDGCASNKGTDQRVSYDTGSIVTIVKQYYPDYAILQLEELSESLQTYFKLTYGHAQPGCVTDDFDGNGFVDHALLLLLKTKTKEKPFEKIVVLLGKEKGVFDPINIDEIGKGTEGSYLIENCFIRHVPAGRIEEWDRSKVIVIERPGFEWVNWESSACVYYWQDGTLQHIWTSD